MPEKPSTNFESFFQSFEELINSLREDGKRKNKIKQKEFTDFLGLDNYSQIKNISENLRSDSVKKVYSYHLHTYLNTDRFKIHDHKWYDYRQDDYDEESWSQFEYAVDEFCDIPWCVVFFVEEIATKTKFIVHLDFEDFEWGAYRFYYAPKNKAKINKISTGFKKFFKENNIFKNKKLEFTKDGPTFIRDSSITFKDVILDPVLKQEIDENIINFFNKRKFYDKNNIPQKRGVIFSGDPGCGKSLSINAISNELAGKITFICVSAKSAPYVDSIAAIYDFARDLAPSIIVFEDLDLFGGDRAKGEFSPQIGELLNQMDGLVENKQIVTIATTNHPERLDTALKDRPSRFDRQLKFFAPTPELIIELFNKYLSGHDCDESIDLDYLSYETKGFSGAQIKEVVISATLDAMNNTKSNGKVVLTMENLLNGIKKSKNNFDYKKSTGKLGFS